MASQKSVREHIERVEYLKETARIRIEKIIRKIPTDELIRNNPVRMAKEITRSVRKGLEKEIQGALLEARNWAAKTGMDSLSIRESTDIAERVVKEWSAAFEQRTTRTLIDMQKQISRDLKRGVSGDQFKKALQRPAMKEKIHKEVAQKARSMGNSLTNDIGSNVREKALGKTPGKFTWVTTEDDNVCSDSFETACEERHGVERTAKEWRKVGLPGSTVLLCSSFGRIQCRCDIIANNSKEADLYEKVNVSDAVKKGKAKAAADSNKTKP
jgi:hypothetical protein